MSGFEWRVRWRREGRATKSVIRQSAEAAHRKAGAIMALEQAKPGTTYDDMPDLVGPPLIEIREVGAWRAAEHQPPAPTEAAVERMREELTLRGYDRNAPAARGHDDDIPF